MPTNHTPTLYLAIPAMDEFENMAALLDILAQQDYPHRAAFICVNQPDTWWDDDQKRSICLNNQKTLSFLHNHCDTNLVILDRSSPGKGWTKRHQGVGWARKTAMDAINQIAHPHDLIVSMDADTYYPTDYLSSLAENLTRNPQAAGFAIPYYHNLTHHERTDRAILRYEIYMRYYACNLWRCHLPYRFTAVGSAMAATAEAYRKISGITPHRSGEDFYFLQKLAKTGTIVTWNRQRAYPAARFSDRVLFGTGPAMIKGDQGDWNSYPFYDPAKFDLVADTFKHLPEALQRTVPNEFISFVNQQLNTEDLFEPLRRNHTELPRFVKSATERLDALRILQYLRYAGKDPSRTDEEIVFQYLTIFHPAVAVPPFSFTHSPIAELDKIRNIFAALESEYQKNEWNKN